MMKNKFKLLLSFLLSLAVLLCVGCTDSSDTREECSHNYYYVDTIEATCTLEGIAGHYACEKCDKLFDVETKSEISDKDIVLSKLGHDFDSGEIYDLPTCQKEGKKVFSCSRCNESKTETIPKNEHDYSVWVTTEQTHGYKCSVCNDISQQSTAPHEFTQYVCDEENGHYATCEICDYEGLLSHRFEGDICIDCGYLKETEAPDGPQLAYQKTADGYKVVGLGTVEGTDIVIPEKWRNRPVVEIAPNAFLNSNVTSVHIGASVRELKGAILGMSELETITIDIDNPVFYVENNCVLERATNKLICGTNTDTIPNVAVSVEDYAFYMNKLFRITIPENVKHIGFKAFYQTALTSVIIEDGVETFDDAVFQNCTELVEINLPDSIVDVGEYTFAGCTKLKSLVLPANISEIGTSFLHLCDKLESLTLNDKLEKIGTFALSGLDSLTELVIPSSVNEISKYAFFLTKNVRITFETPNGWIADGEKIEFVDPDFNYFLLDRYYDCIITK